MEHNNKTSHLVEKEEAVKINHVLGKLKDIQTNRVALEKQWHINVAFIYGHQHFTIGQKGSSLGDRIFFALNRLEDSRKLRRVSNKILVNFRSLLSRMMLRKARVVVDPETRLRRDVESSKVAEEVLEDVWKRVNKNNPYLVQKIPGMVMVQKYLYMWILTFGKAWLHPYFNAKTKSKTRTTKTRDTGDIIKGDPFEAEIGEVEVKVKSPINTFFDPLGQFVIDREVMSVSQIREEYGVDIEPETIDRTDIEEQILRLIEKTDVKKVDNAATLYRYHELPSKKHKNGRFMVHTQKKIISDEGLPEELKGRLPYIEFNWLDLMMTMNTQGLIEQLIPLQKDYNFTISRIAEYKKYFSGKLLVKDGSRIQTKWTDETGQIIKYAGQTPPEYSVPPNPPSFLFEDLKRIGLDMQDIAMSHDSTIGKVPTGVKSGIALQELQEQDDTNLSPTIIEIEEKLAYFAEMVLDIIAAKYKQERILSTVGRESEDEVRTFMGFETEGNRRISISLGSALPGTRQARQAFIGELLSAQIITPPEAKKLLQLGDVEGAFDNVDERKQKSENALMLNGNLVDINKWDKHDIHLVTIRDFMEEPRFEEFSDAIKAFFIAHYEEHLLALAQEVNPNENPENPEEVTPGQATTQPAQPQGV